MSTPAQYRVEHRQPCRSTTLAVLTNAKPSIRALDPFLSRLLHDGKSGWAVLVDEATGAVVARRRIEPPRRPELPATPMEGRQAPAAQVGILRERLEDRRPECR